MPASPWRTLGATEPNGEYVALLSYLPLKSYWRIPFFFLYTAQVVKQLASAEGILGYSVLAPAVKAILDALRLEGRGGAPNFRSAPAARAHYDRAYSPTWARLSSCVGRLKALTCHCVGMTRYAAERMMHWKLRQCIAF